MIKVSVIVPVYNVEKYILSCLKSIADSTYRDIEVICVDDGSTDNSLSTMQNFAQKDSRFVIFNQKNAGVAAARNYGIKMATGHYLIFVDADDFIEKDLIEKALKTISREKTDVVLFGLNQIDQNNQSISEFRMPFLNKLKHNQQNLTTLSILKSCSDSVADKMFRGDFIRKNQITFPVGIQIAEDGIFCINTFLKGATLAFLPEGLYNYRLNRNGSITTNRSDCIGEHIKAFNWLQQTPWYQQTTLDIKKIIIDKYISGCIYFINKSPNWQGIYKQQTKCFIKELQKIYGRTTIKELKNYKKLKRLLRQNNIMSYLFNIEKTQNKKYKIINLLFIKIKLKRK